jgi:hypothetical protein
MSWSFEFSCGIWSQQSDQKAIQVIVKLGPDGSSRFDEILELIACIRGNSLE